MVTFRKFYLKSPKTTKDKSMKASNKISRIAESLILFCTGFVIIAFIATNTSTGGRLLILDQLNPAFAKINIIVALFATAGLLTALTAAFLGRTSIGFTIAVVFMSGYGILLNNHSDYLQGIASGDSSAPPIPYTISISNR